MREQTKPPELIIAFLDGPRDKAEASEVNIVREIIRTVNWTDVQLVERPKNLGSATNIVLGLDDVLRSHSAAIVVEDDILPGRYFCQSMRDMLGAYAYTRSVFSVGGFPCLKPDALPNYPYDVVMSHRFCAWGWGTWADRWQIIKPYLSNFRSPFSSRDQVPLSAGGDIPNTIRLIESRPGFYWDYPITLLSLYHGWYHALTRYYLTQNIGLRMGTNPAGPHLAQFIMDNSPLAERLPVRFPVAEERPEVSSAVQEYIRDYSRAMLEDASLNMKAATSTSFQRSIADMLSTWTHMDNEKHQLDVRIPDSAAIGFFGNCTITLWALTNTYPTDSFVKVNWPTQSIWRDSDQAGENLFDLYFNQNTKADLQQLTRVRPVDFRGVFSVMPFNNLTPYVQNYFTPSKTVRLKQEELEHKYNIDYEKTIVLWYRGTDKWTELSPIPPSYYIAETARLLSEDNDLRALIQTDQKQVRDECVSRLGRRAFYFDELPVTSSLTGIHHIPAESRGISNFQFGVTLLAVANMIARCRYVVASTGQLVLWACLYRGTANNVTQFRPRPPEMISNYEHGSNVTTTTDYFCDDRLENFRLRTELNAIMNSSMYRCMKYVASGIDRLSPDNTRRGHVRKRATNWLKPHSSES